MEESAFRNGLHKKPSFLEYRLPTFLDMPPVESIIVENPDLEGPYGAKEAGEGPLNPVPPAIANAVYDAVGVRFDATPITRDKIVRALTRGPTGGPGARGQGPVPPRPLPEGGGEGFSNPQPPTPGAGGAP